MNIHEYQAKELLAAYGAPVPKGILALTAEQAQEAARALGGACVLKAQAHCGGRGKAGGVKFASSPEEAYELAKNMIGMKLVTKQTGEKGKTVRKLYVTEPVSHGAEYYLALTTDFSSARPVFIACAEGGTEIEELFEKSPEKVARVPFGAELGLKDYTVRALAAFLGVRAENYKEFSALLYAMYKLYTDKNCSLIEINPLALTDGGALTALDAKITFDDNALFRHPEVAVLRDEAEEDPKEVEAEKYGLSYIALDGNIGCLVNGAGLAMATMDILSAFGGRPANFLDVGGSAGEEKVAAAFGILLSDENVRAIMVNIFGGIMKCDVIAAGILEAAEKTGLRVPVVVRLEGTNVERGKEILRASGLKLISASDMADAARKCVELTKAGETA